MCVRKHNTETAEVCLIYLISQELIYLSSRLTLFPERGQLNTVFWGLLCSGISAPSCVAAESWQGFSICFTTFICPEVDRVVPEWTQNRTGVPCVCQEDDGGGGLLHHLPQGDVSRRCLQIPISGRWNTATASLWWRITISCQVLLVFFFYFARPVHQSTAWGMQQLGCKQNC